MRGGIEESPLQVFTGDFNKPAPVYSMNGMRSRAPNVVSLRKIPPFRLIGSKYNVLRNLLEVIVKNDIDGKVFFDVFSGSAVVGRYFKKMFSIISNDNLYFSYVLQKALITLNQYPGFENLKISRSTNPIRKIRKTLRFLNKLKDKEGFIYQHYTPASLKTDGVERKYFSLENGRRIDSVRSKIKEWYDEGAINEDGLLYLVSSLLIAVQRVANISGTYGAFNKFWDPRARKPLKLKFISVIPSSFSHRAFCEDSLELVKKVKCDIAYLDPPYNTRQYITNYHLLETIARYDNPEIHGKTGLRNYGKKEKSDFCSKTTVKKAFISLLSEINTRCVILSYNNEGLLSSEAIVEIFDGFEKFSPVIFHKFPYRRFKSQNSQAKNRVKEYVIVSKVIK